MCLFDFPFTMMMIAASVASLVLLLLLAGQWRPPHNRCTMSRMRPHLSRPIVTEPAYGYSLRRYHELLWNNRAIEELDSGTERQQAQHLVLFVPGHGGDAMQVCCVWEAIYGWVCVIFCLHTLTPNLLQVRSLGSIVLSPVLLGRNCTAVYAADFSSEPSALSYLIRRRQARFVQKSVEALVALHPDVKINARIDRKRFKLSNNKRSDKVIPYITKIR